MEERRERENERKQVTRRECREERESKGKLHEGEIERREERGERNLGKGLRERI